MSTTGTTDQETPTVTTDTTDDTVESPVTRPPWRYRAMDITTGTSLMIFGGVLVWKGLKPQEYDKWQSH